uniref:Cystatin domain-containing protein n=1 Tax=Anguilla anguilla TaxID=7936 RepID=A0A0E9WMP6_ANGAN
MCCSPLILLLITGALLIPTEGQHNHCSFLRDYHKLLDTDKAIVDMAIKHVNTELKQHEQHMNFLCFLWRKPGSKLLSAELLLRATGCKNSGMTTHQNHCKFTEPKQFTVVNCRVCIDDLTRREPSFIHCDWQKNATTHAEHRRNGCEKHSHGGSTSLAQVTDMDPAPECLGCL